MNVKMKLIFESHVKIMVTTYIVAHCHEGVPRGFEDVIGKEFLQMLSDVQGNRPDGFLLSWDDVRLLHEKVLRFCTLLLKVEMP